MNDAVVRTASELRGASVLVRPGRRDPIARAGAAEALAGALEGAGTHVTLEWTDAAHALTADDAASARAWLAALRDARNHPG